LAIPNGSTEVDIGVVVHPNATGNTSLNINLDSGSTGSSGSSNGGSSNGICVPYWNCTSWGPCEYNLQFRTCTDKWGCDRYEDQPIQSRNCTIELGNVTGEVNMEGGEPENKTTVETIVEETTEIVKDNWEFTLFLSIILVVGLIWLYVTHKKKKKENGIQERN